MKISPVVIGPTGTVPDLSIAVQELANRVRELQSIVQVIGPKGTGLALGRVAFVDEAGTWHKASRASAETAPVTGYGIVMELSTGSSAKIQIATVADVFSGLVSGKTYYLGDDGEITLDTAGPIVVALGRAVSPTGLLLQPAYIGDV